MVGNIYYQLSRRIWNATSSPDPYRQDLAFRLLSAVRRRPKERTKANIPLANLHESWYFVKFGSSRSGMRNSSTSPYIHPPQALINITESAATLITNKVLISLTLMACCMKSIAISRPNNSPARRVNLLIMEQAPRIAKRKSKNALQTQTL